MSSSFPRGNTYASLQTHPQMTLLQEAFLITSSPGCIGPDVFWSFPAAPAKYGFPLTKLLCLCGYPLELLEDSDCVPSSLCHSQCRHERLVQRKHQNNVDFLTCKHCV